MYGHTTADMLTINNTCVGSQATDQTLSPLGGAAMLLLLQRGIDTVT